MKSNQADNSFFADTIQTSRKKENICYSSGRAPAAQGKTDKVQHIHHEVKVSELVISRFMDQFERIFKAYEFCELVIYAFLNIKERTFK